MTSCHGCADPFGFWKRNVGCPRCHFSYCQRCIRFKLSVIDEENPNKENTIIVCQKCYLEAQNTSDRSAHLLESERSPGTILASNAMEVLESMDNPGKPPITLYRERNRVAELKKGLSIDDQKIVDRLEELRGVGRRRKSEPLEDEVAARLAKLNDQPYSPETGRQTILTKSKPETEEDLLVSLANQVSIEKNYDDSVVSDIQHRLAKLEGQESPAASSSLLQESATGFRQDTIPMSEEEEVNEIMNRYIAEASLTSAKPKVKTSSESVSDDENVAGGEISEEEDDIDVDQLCRICEEKRATIMCKECDEDIFCARCFKEFHEELGESHKPGKVNFNPLGFK